MHLAGLVKHSVFLAVLGTASLLAFSAADAQSIDEIAKKGRISIGVLTGAPPYDSVDKNGNIVGYHVDVAHLIGKELGVEVDIVPVNNSSRVAALESKRIDIQIAQTTPTPQRAKVLMFTSPYGSYQLSIIGKKGDVITKPEEMAGKSVSVPKGSIQDMTLSGMNIPNLTIVRFDDDATAMQALVSSKVDMTGSLAVMAMDFLKREGLSEKFEVKFPLQTRYFSIAVRKDAFELHQWLNTFLFCINISGELDDLHRKWTGVPIPGGRLPSF